MDWLRKCKTDMGLLKYIILSEEKKLLEFSLGKNSFCNRRQKTENSFRLIEVNRLLGIKPNIFKRIWNYIIR